MTQLQQNKLFYFPEASVSGIALPGRFTFPFCYEPHPLSQIAAAELQQYLASEAALDHNFGLDETQHGLAIGKMFGVLVVQDTDGRLGYLCAFSGKLAGSNDHPCFVPPVFDMLTEQSFFLQEQPFINAINQRVKALESSAEFRQLQQVLGQETAQSAAEIAACKKALKTNKAERDALRAHARESLSPEAYEALQVRLSAQSVADKRQLHLLCGQWEQRLGGLAQRLVTYEQEISALKNERKARSAALQQQLFEQYVFLNRYGKNKSLQAIFSETAFGSPPSAAGECATPKLLQFAFKNGYRPLAMAEFWWGASPKSEIRRHKQFYPACTGKCQPILAHMLEGIPLDENPLLQQRAIQENLDIIYEDESFLVVNKPHGLRSVPGVNIQDSVYSRLQQRPGTAEPLIVHRLDMDTSGLLVVAKTAEAHKHIQKQFLRRTVKKRYTALLSKAIDQCEGELSLPLRPDPYNRPRQLVCMEQGKKSITRWQVLSISEGITRIAFWPLTGRTHQLRMHAAHELGLHAPIVGDDLYGTAADRMYLHAAWIELQHPLTKERISFEVKEDF